MDNYINSFLIHVANAEQLNYPANAASGLRKVRLMILPEFQRESFAIEQRLDVKEYRSQELAF